MDFLPKDVVWGRDATQHTVFAPAASPEPPSPALALHGGTCPGGGVRRRRVRPVEEAVEEPAAVAPGCPREPGSFQQTARTGLQPLLLPRPLLLLPLLKDGGRAAVRGVTALSSGRGWGPRGGSGTDFHPPLPELSPQTAASPQPPHHSTLLLRPTLSALRGGDLGFFAPHQSGPRKAK